MISLQDISQPLQQQQYPVGDIRRLGNIVEFRKKFDENYTKAQQAKLDFQQYQNEIDVFGRAISKFQ
ncbi:MAG: hypothetical protein ACD_19C00187G0026 [uncultured bacterium]|nr:MAG: hypothetical protein ACD_19C00187G0026 [uncultured bacterium]